eukprot:Rhum_TRINITY_DN4476_c1_g1::Rhum_TRINITY_DN4476_c1_g1_i1::g.14531::m.14531
MCMKPWAALALLAFHAPLAVFGGIVTPDCNSGMMVIPTPADNKVTINCGNSNCDNCEFTCPAGKECEFTCSDCDNTVINCGSASSCKLACQDDDSCSSTTINGQTTPQMSVECKRDNACKSSSALNCPTAAGSTCGIMCERSSSCRSTVGLRAASTTIRCNTASACKELKTKHDINSDPAGSTGDLSLECTTQDACKDLDKFECPYTGACNVRCATSKACEKLDPIKNGKGPLTITCQGKDACKELEVNGEDGWSTGKITMSCNGEEACDTALIRCEGDCSLTCETPKACKKVDLFPGAGTTTVRCSGGGEGCKELDIKENPTHPTGTVIFDCVNHKACDGAKLDCPVRGTCTINCEADRSCDGFNVNCDNAETTCLANCKARGSCRAIDYDCRPNNGRTATCRLDCQASEACPFGSVTIQGDLTGTTCDPEADQTLDSACPYSGTPDRQDVAFWALMSPVLCTTHTCSAGYTAKTGMGIMCPASGCTDAACCDPVKCATHACDTDGFQDKAGKAAIVCTGTPPACDDATC